MKARALQKRLDTERTVHETEECINVASPFVSELISLNKKTLKLKYALDAFGKGRDSLKNVELKAIWDSLLDLCLSGEIHQYITGEDDIETKTPVYYEEDGRVIEGVTDYYGWPNITSTGLLMYENTFFPTRPEAIDCMKENLNGAIKYRKESISDKMQDIEKMEREITEFRKKLMNLN